MFFGLISLVQLRPGSLPESAATALLLMHFFVSIWVGARMDAKNDLMLRYFRELAFMVTQAAHEEEVSFNYDVNTVLAVTAAGTVFGFHELLNKINQNFSNSIKKHWSYMVESGILGLDIFSDDLEAPPTFVDLLIFCCIAEKVRRAKKVHRWGSGVLTVLKNLKNALLEFIDLILNNQIVKYMYENDPFRETVPSSRRRRRTGFIFPFWGLGDSCF